VIVGLVVVVVLFLLLMCLTRESSRGLAVVAALLLPFSFAFPPLLFVAALFALLAIRAFFRG
jgi:hypothetical protein